MPSAINYESLVVNKHLVMGKGDSGIAIDIFSMGVAVGDLDGV